MKLTDNQCKNAVVPSGKKSTQLRDGNGLYLEIRDNGAKYWRMKYTSPITKKQVILHLGSYTELSLKSARLDAAKARLLIANGIDPKEKKQATKAEETANRQNTFEYVARAWHQHRANLPDKWKPDHAKRVIRSLELHIFPHLANRPITDIAPLEILELLKDIERAGKYDTAQKVYDVVRQVFSYAVRLRLCPFNPAAELGCELAQVPQTSFPHIIEPKQIAQLLRDIDGYGGTPVVRTLLKISPYVFTRPSELRLMKWKEVDFQAALWQKDGVLMKNGLPHFIPLCRQVLALLEEMKAFTGHYEYVFWNKSKQQPISEAAAERALHRLGYKDIMTPHGFRHMASTRLNEMNYNSDWIEYQLAHKDPNTSRASYNSAKYIEQRAQMLQEWADYLDELKQTI